MYDEGYADGYAQSAMANPEDDSYCSGYADGNEDFEYDRAYPDDGDLVDELI